MDFVTDCNSEEGRGESGAQDCVTAAECGETMAVHDYLIYPLDDDPFWQSINEVQSQTAPRKSSYSTLEGALSPVGFERIPMRAYQSPQLAPPKRAVVQFHTQNQDCISLHSALEDDVTGLTHGNIIVFSDTHKPSIRFLWPIPETGPQYHDYGEQINFPASMTKAGLAKKIADAFSKFYEDRKKMPYGDDTWRLGEGYITMEDLFLHAVKYVSTGTVQVELWRSTNRH